MTQPSKTRKTNIEFVTDFMEGEGGALAQCFVIEALRRYANACADAPPAEMDTGFISGEAWKATAQLLRAKLRERGIS